MDNKFAVVMALVADEVASAQEKFKPYNSMHEAHSVIQEEFVEFWDEVKNNKADGADRRQMRELIQVAATAVRALVNLVKHEHLESEEQRRGLSE